MSMYTYVNAYRYRYVSMPIHKYVSMPMYRYVYGQTLFNAKFIVPFKGLS